MTDVTAQSNPQNQMGDIHSKFSLSGISVRNLLTGGFAIACLVLVVAMGAGILGANKEAAHIIDARDRTIPTTIAISELQQKLVETEVYTGKWVATGESRFTDALNQNWSDISALQAQIDESLPYMSGAYSGIWQDVKGQLREYQSAQNQVVRAAGSSGQLSSNSELIESLTPLERRLRTALVGETGLLIQAREELNGTMTALADEANTLSSTLWILLVAGVLLTAAAGVIASRAVLTPLSRLADMVVEIADGKVVDIPGLDRKDPLGQLARSLQLIVNSARESLRTKAALDSCRTNVMVADENYDIVYVNETMREMLTSNEGNMRKDLPNFDAKTIVGTNIDDFHKNPAHQRGMLAHLRATTETSLDIGGRNFDLVVSPVLDNDQNRIGTVVEWADVTEQKQREAEETRVANENSRIKSALDSCRTNVMVADADYNIVYVNNTMLEMLQGNEGDMRKDLPNFKADDIVGTNIDTFHKNPAHQRGMLDALTGEYEANLSIGGREYDLVVSPILDDQKVRIGTVVEWEDVTERNAQRSEERRIANENSRIKSALDNCTTNMMVADEDYNIVYVNETMKAMLHKNESNMREELTNFDAATIVGTNIDTFHKNPSHQRGMLDRLTQAYETSIEVGGKFYNLIASPVLTDEGERIGTIVEWADVTAEKLIEQEIDGVVSAAVAGDFSSKLQLDGKEGFMLRLSEAINSLSDTVSNAMEDVGTALSALSNGDLTKRITADYQGLFDVLKSNTNGTSEQLASIVADIMTAGSEVANAAQEINMGTMDLSQRTEQQASNLEETAAAMEQMASTVKQNAENAQQANQLSISARDVAERGGGVVGEVVEAMSRIEGSSQKISDIISVIDEIAFQTNLLALNAAVEAARAGDAGKGFAVVAAEVGTLAQRSSQAAKDIKGLINDSGSQVKDGVRLVGNAGESLTEIVDSIKRLSDIVSEIAAASNEQSTSINEINRSVSQMDEMTQQNSALVEENAAASRTLQEQSESMRDRISFFKVDDSVAPSPAKPAARAKSTAMGSGSGASKSVAMPVMAMSNGQAAAEDWSEF